MKLWVKNKRKDGKYSVTIGFDNGTRFNKIVTPEQLDKFKRESDNYSATR